MKKLTLSGSVQFFIAIVCAQNLHPGKPNAFDIINRDKTFGTQQTDLAVKERFAIVITTTGTTNDAGCNPDAATIDAALGSANAASDCGAVTVTSSDGPITSSNCDRSQTRTWTATDACGGLVTASRTVAWKVDVTPPDVTLTGSINNLGCNPTQTEINSAFGSVTVTDNCTFGVITTVDEQIQSFGCNRTQTRIWTATDNCGNITTVSSTVTWIDSPPPLVSITPPNPLGCNPTNAEIEAAFGIVTVSGGCGVQAVLSDGPVNAIACGRSKTRTWTVTDLCGHVISTSRTVTWTVDITPPAIGTTPDIAQNTDPGLSTAIVNVVTPTVTDNCGGTPLLNVARSDNLAINDPYPLGTTTLTWSAVDMCGNAVVQNQTITVSDGEVPLIGNCPAPPPQCFNANSFYSIPELTATDNTGDVSIQYEITGATSRRGATGDASGLFNPGFSNIRWTVADASGNTSTCSTSVVIDKIDASIPDAFAENISPEIGSANTIYVGYGDKSITLTSNIRSSVNSGFYSYKWTIGSPGGTKIGTGPTVTVSPTTTTTYYLSVKDENNCSQTMQVSKQIIVDDIRCGTDRVLVCEVQKNGSVKTNCIPASKVPSISPGSRLGSCPNLITRSDIKQDSKRMQSNTSF